MKEKVAPAINFIKALSPQKRILIIVGFLVILALPFTVLLAQQKQDLLEHAAASNDLYVSASGNDTNPGTQASPLATITAAAALATPGTKVHVAPGTYNQTVETDTSGTANARITYISDQKWGAKIVSAGTPESTDATWQNKGDYVDISGFDVSGGTRIGIVNRASHVGIMQNKIHDVAVGYCQSLGGAGIDSAYSPGQQDNEYSQNFVSNVGPKPCSYVHGIYIQSLNERVINNIIFNNGGLGIACTHGCNAPDIANNLIFNNGYGIRIGWSQDTTGKTSNAFVTNNIVMNNMNYAIYEYPPGLGTNNLLSNNILIGNNPNTCSANDCQNTINVDPKFVNYQPDGSGDYHLKPNSPAIDAGTKAGAAAVDYDGNVRPSGKAIDIGPYEYQSNSPTPTTTATPTCLPKPSCPAGKACPLYMPAGGWCGITPSPVPTPTNPTPPPGCYYTSQVCSTVACFQGKPCPTCPPGKLVCPSPTPVKCGNLTCSPGQNCVIPTCPPTAAGAQKQVCDPIPTCVNSSPTPTPPTTFKLGDINEDGKLDVNDYNILISCSVYSRDNGALCNTNPSYRINSDLNHDGKIDLDDLSIFIRAIYQSQQAQK